MTTNNPKSSLKSARFNANKMRKDLAQRYSLRWHGFFLGSLTLGITWLTSACLLMAGVDSMAVRYGIAFVIGYLASSACGDGTCATRIAEPGTMTSFLLRSPSIPWTFCQERTATPQAPPKP